MVRTSALLISLGLCLAACESIPAVDVQYDYPGKKTGKTSVVNAKPKEEASIPSTVMNDAVVEKKEEKPRTGIFNELFSGLSAPKVEAAKPSSALPFANAEKYLTEYKEGQTATATAADGKAVEFKVISEYVSASQENCKKYSIAEVMHLACHGNGWYPVRSFEE